MPSWLIFYEEVNRFFCHAPTNRLRFGEVVDALSAVLSVTKYEINEQMVY